MKEVSDLPQELDRRSEPPLFICNPEIPVVPAPDFSSLRNQIGMVRLQSSGCCIVDTMIVSPGNHAWLRHFRVELEELGVTLWAVSPLPKEFNDNILIFDSRYHIGIFPLAARILYTLED